MKDKTYLLGEKLKPQRFKEGIATDDPKINFVIKYVVKKNVLDLGCVQHNPRNYKSEHWLHKAIKVYANKVIGLDIYEEGVIYLNNKGFNVLYGDAENFCLKQKFDVIVVGDLIEHLANPGMMLECAKQHINENGVLIIVTPNPWYWRFLFKNILFKSSKPNPEHTCWYCLDTLRHLLCRYDWEIVEYEYNIVQYEYHVKKIIDKIIPFPKLLKYNSLHVCARVAK